MVNFLVTFALFFSVISGTSRILVVVSGLLILGTSLYRLFLNSGSFGYVTKSAFRLVIFVIFALSSILMMPAENVPKFGMTFASIILSVLLIKNVLSMDGYRWPRVITVVLVLILLGDLLHLSGFLGQDMSEYKKLVQFDELSNVDRERDLSVLGFRYYGWFGEPSYHGSFVGLLCALIWNAGFYRRSLGFFLVLLLFCPTPIMPLSFLLGVISAKNSARNVLNLPLRNALIATVVMVVGLGAFGDRLFALQSSMAVLSNGEVNSSEAVRLFYPLAALTSHLETYTLFPESVICTGRWQCAAGSDKLPLITFFLFFGLSGLITILVLNSLFSRIKNIFLVFFVSLIASILSGGAAYLLHYNLLVAFFLNMPRGRMIDILAPSGRSSFRRDALLEGRR